MLYLVAPFWEPILANAHSISPSPGEGGGALAVLSNRLFVWSMKSTEMTAMVIRTISQSTNQPRMVNSIVAGVVVTFVVVFVVVSVFHMMTLSTTLQHPPPTMNKPGNTNGNIFFSYEHIVLIAHTKSKICFIDRRKVS